MRLRVLSWNILSQWSADQTSFRFSASENEDAITQSDLDWYRRFPTLIERIRSYEADVIALQEVDNTNIDDFVNALRDYAVLVSPKSNGRDSILLLVHRGREFTRFNFAYDTYNVCGVVIETTAFMPVHLKAGRNEQCDQMRKAQASMLVQGIKHEKCVVLGDFNAEVTNPCLSPLWNFGFLPLQNTAETTRKSRRRGAGEVDDIDACIDHILVYGKLNGGCVTTYYPVCPLLPTRSVPSDHQPVVADINV